MKTITEYPENTDYYPVMKENKVLTQDIWKMSILYSKTFKEFYHYMKFRKILMNRTRRCSIKKLFFKILQFLQENTYVGVSFLIKIHAFNTIHVFSWQYCEILRTVILKNICERLLLRVFPFMSVWTFSYMNK